MVLFFVLDVEWEYVVGEVFLGRVVLDEGVVVFENVFDVVFEIWNGVGIFVLEFDVVLFDVIKGVVYGREVVFFDVGVVILVVELIVVMKSNGEFDVCSINLLVNVYD